MKCSYHLTQLLCTISSITALPLYEIMQICIINTQKERGTYLLPCVVNTWRASGEVQMLAVSAGDEKKWAVGHFHTVEEEINATLYQNGSVR